MSAIDDGVVVSPPPLPPDVVEYLRQEARIPYAGESAGQRLLEKYVPEAERERLLEDELQAAKLELAQATRRADKAEAERKWVAEVNQAYGKQINQLTARVKAALAQQHALEDELRTRQGRLMDEPFRASTKYTPDPLRSFVLIDGRKYELSSMERSLDPDGEITFRFTPVKET